MGLMRGSWAIVKNNENFEGGAAESGASFSTIRARKSKFPVYFGRDTNGEGEKEANHS